MLALTADTILTRSQYVYFTLAAINIRVPQALKRTLTTMQITQFLVGASYAALHLFVKYDIPITTMYKVLHPVSSAASVASSTAVSLTSSAAQATSSPALGAQIMRLLLRAAGDEGVAENVRDSANQVIIPGVADAVRSVAHKFYEETIYRTEYTKVDCIDTTGESFAVWLNLFYLFPLTVLFVRFFIRAYYYRTSSSTPKQGKRHAASYSAMDAAKGVDREVDEPSKAAERELEKDVDAMRKGEYKGSQTVQRRLSQVADVLSPSRAGRALSDAADAMQDAMKNVKEETINSRVASDDDNSIVRDQATGDRGTENSNVDNQHDSGDESHSEKEDANATPSKKNKKKRNRKHKKHSGANSQVLETGDAVAPSSAAHTDPNASAKEA